MYRRGLKQHFLDSAAVASRLVYNFEIQVIDVGERLLLITCVDAPFLDSATLLYENLMNVSLC